MNEKELLINKYKPEYFHQFHINENIIELLNRQISLNKLITILIGEEGTGKTILLKAIVNEYYKDILYSQYKHNILYINTLNEQGIKYFRNEVKLFCQTCSVIPGKKKLIILDDLDILCETNQKIFINIVDKYSDNISFIASCTFIQKITDGLKSRFMLVQLPLFNAHKMKLIADNIILQEHLNISEDAVNFIIHVSHQKVNRLINYIEKIKLYGERVDLTIAKQLCTNINTSFFTQYFHYLQTRQLLQAIYILYEINDQGFSVIDILDLLVEYVKNNTISQTQIESTQYNEVILDTYNTFDEQTAYNIIHIICKYITIFYNIHEDEIELAIFTYELLSTIYK